MIDGMDGERGAMVSGGRGYYLKVTVILSIGLCSVFVSSVFLNISLTGRTLQLV